MSKQNRKEWLEYKLKDLGSIYNGLVGKKKNDFETGEYFITYLQVLNNQSDNISHFGKVKIAQNENQNKVKYGDILFTTSSETPEETGLSTVYLNKNFEPYLNSFCFGFRLNNFDILDPVFAFYYFRGNNFRKSIFPLAQGSTRYNLSKKYFLELTIKIPTINEQKEIAVILSSMDKLILKTKQKLMKTNLLKKSITEDFLTGRSKISSK